MMPDLRDKGALAIDDDSRRNNFGINERSHRGRTTQIIEDVADEDAGHVNLRLRDA